mgnify:CR=1 FL=1
MLMFMCGGGGGGWSVLALLGAMLCHFGTHVIAVFRAVWWVSGRTVNEWWQWSWS